MDENKANAGSLQIIDEKMNGYLEKFEQMIKEKREENEEGMEEFGISTIK